MMGSLVFLHPWVLGALAALPVLWFLLRMMPPAPRHIAFAPVRFLAGLIPERKTPSRTPWWILLLRCLIVVLIVLALAAPADRPSEETGTAARLRIVLDNSWGSAALWNRQIARAEDLIARAGRDNIEIEIAATAPLADTHAPLAAGPLSAGDALSLLRGLSPLPWPADTAALLKALEEKSGGGPVQTHWLGNGLDENGFAALAAFLQENGSLSYYKPDDKDLPVLLKPDETAENSLGVKADVPGAVATANTLSVEAVSGDGRVLGRQTLATRPGEYDAKAVFELPPDVRGLVAKFRVAGRRGAGGVLLVDDLSRRRMVGIVSSKGIADTKPFIDALFYLTRALSPYADMAVGDTGELLRQAPDALIVTDDAALTPDALQALEGWMKQGGLILRFAGPNMTDGAALTPVPLRGGQRAMEGKLSWERPQKLSSFPADGPFADIALTEDIVIKSQVLADPAFDLTGKVWAALDDGTPLITAAPQDKGLLVMVHTSAAPDWSDLPLSGLYVKLLRRIVAMSAGVGGTQSMAGDMTPVSVMDGYGDLQAPKNEAPIPAGEFSARAPNSRNPPGFYGRGGYTEALNLGERLGPLKPIPSLPAGASLQGYDMAIQKNYGPLLLAAAFALFLTDWLVLMALTGSVRRVAWKPAAMILLALSVSFPARAAQDGDARLATDIHFGYVRSGDPGVDRVTEDGLSVLAKVLDQRTSVKIPGIVTVDPASSELSLFPLIYWPVTDDMPALSEVALLNIQHYLDHGGTILFDTRGRQTAALQALLRPLSIPPLVPVSRDHVLNKSFYLIDSYPGRHNEQALWVEENSAAGRDGVSSVIIGSNDWAGAWASESATAGPGYITGATRRQELSLRFGVNLMMYALTGNYKADQVHLPHILQRLDQ